MQHRQLAITVTYKDVVKLIYKTSHRMSSIYFIPFDEILGQANILFMQAYLEYDPECSYRFTTYLQNILYWRLTDWCKNEYVENLHVEINPETAGTVTHQYSWLADLLASVSDEARIVVQAVVRSPKELKDMIMKHHYDDGEWFMAEGKKEIQTTIIKYLRKLGWKAEDVTKGFKEISHVLTNGLPEEKKHRRVHRKCKLTKPQVRLLVSKYLN